MLRVTQEPGLEGHCLVTWLSKPRAGQLREEGPSPCRLLRASCAAAGAGGGPGSDRAGGGSPPPWSRPSPLPARLPLPSRPPPAAARCCCSARAEPRFHVAAEQRAELIPPVNWDPLVRGDVFESKWQGARLFLQTSVRPAPPLAAHPGAAALCWDRPCLQPSLSQRSRPSSPCPPQSTPIKLPRVLAAPPLHPQAGRAACPSAGLC